MSKLLEEFQDYLSKMNQYEHVTTLLYWDMKTGAPKLGQAGHVEALTHFSTEAFALSTSEKLGEMLAGLAKPEEFDALTDTWKFIVAHEARFRPGQTDSGGCVCSLRADAGRGRQCLGGGQREIRL